MRNAFFTVLMIMAATSLFAQDGADADTIPAYKKTTRLPYFAILQPDSTWFTQNQLPQGKPTVIVYFSPECGHCMLTAKEIVYDMNKLKDVEMVWVSYHSPQQIKDFADNYGLSHFNNIIVGRDVNYFFVPFYKIPSTPFMAVYDKKGRFLKAYEGGTSAETIAQLLKKSH